MAKVGADILVAHMGLTTKGSIGAKTALPQFLAALGEAYGKLGRAGEALTLMHEVRELEELLLQTVRD